MRSVLRAIAAVGAVTYVALFVWRNGERPVELDLLLVKLPEVEVWMLALASAVIGAVAATLAFSWPLLRLRIQLRRRHRDVARLEQEVHGLRTLPLTEGDPASDGVPREG